MKKDKSGKILVYKQNAMNPDGSKPKFEFTKLPTKCDEKELTFIGF